MAKCAFCNTSILFGGRKQGDLRYCNSECERKGAVASFASQVPDDLVRQQAINLHGGQCPRCTGSGPVDVHTTYRVWSALLMTQWSSRPIVSCSSCATKRALGDAAFSFALGWWGFPWGLVMTPVQVARNVHALVRRPHSDEPTEALRRMVRMGIAQDILDRQGRQR